MAPKSRPVAAGRPARLALLLLTVVALVLKANCLRAMPLLRGCIDAAMAVPGAIVTGNSQPPAAPGAAADDAPLSAQVMALSARYAAASRVMSLPRATAAGSAPATGEGTRPSRQEARSRFTAPGGLPSGAAPARRPCVPCPLEGSPWCQPGGCWPDEEVVDQYSLDETGSADGSADGGSPEDGGGASGPCVPCTFEGSGCWPRDCWPVDEAPAGEFISGGLAWHAAGGGLGSRPAAHSVPATDAGGGQRPDGTWPYAAAWPHSAAWPSKEWPYASQPQAPPASAAAEPPHGPSPAASAAAAGALGACPRAPSASSTAALPRPTGATRAGLSTAGNTDSASGGEALDPVAASYAYEYDYERNRYELSLALQQRHQQHQDDEEEEPLLLLEDEEAAVLRALEADEAQAARLEEERAGEAEAHGGGAAAAGERYTYDLPYELPDPYRYDYSDYNQQQQDGWQEGGDYDFYEYMHDGLPYEPSAADELQLLAGQQQRLPAEERASPLPRARQPPLPQPLGGQQAAGHPAGQQEQQQLLQPGETSGRILSSAGRGARRSHRTPRLPAPAPGSASAAGTGAPTGAGAGDAGGGAGSPAAAPAAAALEAALAAAQAAVAEAEAMAELAVAGLEAGLAQAARAFLDALLSEQRAAGAAGRLYGAQQQQPPQQQRQAGAEPVVAGAGTAAHSLASSIPAQTQGTGGPAAADGAAELTLLRKLRLRARALPAAASRLRALYDWAQARLAQDAAHLWEEDAAGMQHVLSSSGERLQRRRWRAGRDGEPGAPSGGPARERPYHDDGDYVHLAFLTDKLAEGTTGDGSV